ncbi:thiol peroxidase [Helicobacter mustelae]|uniref:Thiol peroxidase n=1 Tax=Helicobacter mustelae (strain ATCC 43772 / CCUG 25715 / CIP 103759 / LMG 18044 / NCTC 12198 / R85-136P) TaxID=679897 RepID=D3UFW2_HELM1|nr:thiol peroxidase [Helicobacter mustelae]CBG39383.1 probable thiol peroxidase [Helicobacter mustelae 12198]SQH70896.1 thiol peroxidase [Helicobacter mustelae]
MKVKFKSQEISLAGEPKKVNENAPEVTLVGKDLSEVKIGGAQGKYQIINVVPSLDTEVCAIQAKNFNKKASELENASVFVVSVDLPFAQGRFCSTEGIENLTVASDFRDHAFGKEYGLRIGEGPLAGLLTRAVIVVDPHGKIIYQEISEEITHEPNYDAPLKVIH